MVAGIGRYQARSLVDKDYFTVKAVAENLDVSHQTVHNLIKAGRLRAYAFGRSIRISKDDFNRFLAESEIQPGQELDDEAAAKEPTA